jgi:hypothetical protein
VAYFSKKLTSPERNYAGVSEHFGYYLVGRHFTITTDHNALEALHADVETA